MSLQQPISLWRQYEKQINNKMDIYCNNYDMDCHTGCSHKVENLYVRITLQF